MQSNNAKPFAVFLKRSAAFGLGWSLVLLFSTVQCAFAALVRQPYLQSLATTSVTIVWRTDNPSGPFNNSRVQFGTSQGNLAQEATGVSVVPNSNPNVKDHFVTVNGLNPGTKYFYNVGTTGGVEGGGTAEHYFTTAPSTGSATPFTVWVIGDSGDGTPDQLAVRDAMIVATGSSPPDVMLHLGDVVYEDGTDAEFTSKHFNVYQNILRHTPSYPTFGNHEAVSANGNLQTGPYFEGHVLPTGGQAGGVPSGTEAYYSFDYGNTHFIVLDSQDSSRTPGSTMLTWLQSDLAASTQKWIVAYWHHPPYTKGTHNSDNASDSGGRLVQMRENVLPILEAGGVDLVLAGHSHNYERSFLLNGAFGYGTSPHFATPSFSTLWANGNILDERNGDPLGDGPYIKDPTGNQGAVYVVAGHGGRFLGGGPQGKHPVHYFTELLAHGSLLIDVSDNLLTVHNLGSDGVITDVVAIDKSSNFGPPAKVVIRKAGTDFLAGGSTTLEVEVQDSAGKRVSTDSTTQITFDPTSFGTVSGVSIGSGDGSYGVVGGAEVVTVEGGIARITLTNAVAETFEVAITNDSTLENPLNDSITVAGPPSGGLVVAYGFEEGSGTATQDWSGNGNNGTLLGGSSFVAGQIGLGAGFDGVDDYVETGNKTNLQNWTVSAWVRSPGAPLPLAQSGPVSRHRNYQIIWNHPSSAFRGAASFNAGGTWYAASFGQLVSNTWYYLAATYDGETLRAYKNGNLITSNTAPSGPPTTESSSLKIGRQGASAEFFQGTVDEVRVYNRALSQVEIQTDMVTSVAPSSGPTKLAVTSVNGGSNPSAGVGFPVVVQSQDSGGTPRNVTANTNVTLSRKTGTGTLGGTLTGTITAGTNQVTITGVTYTKAESGVVVTATRTSGDTLTAGDSAAFTVNAGAASVLVFTTQPGAATAGSTIPGPPTVTVRDSSGNTVTTSTASITVAIGSNPGGGTLSGTLTKSAVSGVASFSNLSINQAGNGYTLTAASASLTGATSSAFNINAGVPIATKLAVTTVNGGSNPSAGVGFPVVVQSQDSGGTPRNVTANTNVTLSRKTGTGTLGGTLTGTITAGTNQVTITGVTYTKAESGVVVTATRTSGDTLTAGDSAAFTVNAGAASVLVFTTQPGAATAGSTIPGPPTVTVRDSSGNTVTTSTASITVAIGSNPGGGTLSGTLTKSAVSGVASFSNLSINQAGNGYTLTAASASLTGATSSAFNINAGVVGGLVVAYGFEEGSGTATQDWSGNGNNGTLLGGSSFVAGQIGLGAGFDGVDDYVETGNKTNLQNWTVSAWVRSPGAPLPLAQSGPVSRHRNYQIIWNHPSSAFRGAASFNAGGTWYAASFGQLVSNTWYYLAATYDGETLRAYKNGDLITSNTAPSGPPTSESSSLKIGRQGSLTEFFQGTVDEVRVYNRALSQVEIQTDMVTSVAPSP